MTPRLKELYYKEIQPALKSQFGFKNLYMGPKIEKIVLNMGLGLDGNDSNIKVLWGGFSKDNRSKTCDYQI